MNQKERNGNVKDSYNVSFRCYYSCSTGPQYNTHYRNLALSDIPRWIEAYQFTHPECLSISVKVWLTEQAEQMDLTDDEEEEEK